MLFHPKLEFTAKQDAEIERVYRAHERGGNKRLAYQFGCSPSAISQRAAVLGLQPLQRANNRKSPAIWKPKELAIVRRHLNESVQAIRAALAKHSYRRDAGAISALLYRKRQTGEWPSRKDALTDRDCYSVQDLASGIGLTRDQVQRWITKGWLPAQKLGGGDGMYAIRRVDLCAALRRHAAHWDHTRADKWFLLDVLCADDQMPKTIQHSAGVADTGIQAARIVVGVSP